MIELQRKRCAILRDLVFCCLPDLEQRLAEAIMKEWSIDEDQFDSLWVRSWPSRVVNLVISNELARWHDLSGISMFYQIHDCWLLDLEPRRAATGFLMPTVDRDGRIVDLLAFRGPHDQRPFLVRVRSERLAA